MVTPLPGGVGLSGLSVYDWPAADGACGGSPHIHLVCAEAYYVVDGEGAVRTLTARGPAETPLRAGRLVWFTPGTIHRLINSDGRLRIVVIMQNSGLPEAGDAVFTFPRAVLDDPGAYEEYARATTEDEARRRRDLAIEGFAELRESATPARLESGRLDGFYEAALRLKRDLLDDWERRWRTGALATAEATGDHLVRLRAGDRSHLHEAEVRETDPPETRKYGMCGRLDTYEVLGGPGATGKRRSEDR